MERYCITVPPSPDIIWGTVFPQTNIWGNSVPVHFPSTTPLLAGIIHTVCKVTHTVYSYGTLMLAVIVTVILTVTQTRELEQRQSFIYWSGISRGKSATNISGVWRTLMLSVTLRPNPNHVSINHILALRISVNPEP